MHKAYPIELLRTERVANDTIAGTELVIIAFSESSDARVYSREGQTFRLSASNVSKTVPTSLVDSDGTEWRVTDDFLVNNADPSQKLPRLPSHVSFWFGWFAFHPDTEVYGVNNGS